MPFHRAILNGSIRNKNIRALRSWNIQKFDRTVDGSYKGWNQHIWHIFISYYKAYYNPLRSLVSLPGGRYVLKLITLYVPETYLKALDQLVGERFYPNRAEAIRVAIRDLISEEVWRRKNVG
jgi:antitoxin ParD1/3/4